MHDAIWILGQGADAMGPYFTPWASLGATVVNTAILIYLITKRGPEERNEYRADMAAERASREKSQEQFQQALDAERTSREAVTEKFMQQLTENREKSHAQRMEDRKVYFDAMQTVVREVMAATKEIKNGHGSA